MTNPTGSTPTHRHDPEDWLADLLVRSQGEPVRLLLEGGHVVEGVLGSAAPDTVLMGVQTPIQVHGGTIHAGASWEVRTSAILAFLAPDNT